MICDVCGADMVPMIYSFFCPKCEEKANSAANTYAKSKDYFTFVYADWFAEEEIKHSPNRVYLVPGTIVIVFNSVKELLNAGGVSTNWLPVAIDLSGEFDFIVGEPHAFQGYCKVWRV